MTDPTLAQGVNTAAGQVTNAAVAEALGRPSAQLPEALEAADVPAPPG
jgi:alanine dehydrogenase